MINIIIKHYQTFIIPLFGRVSLNPEWSDKQFRSRTYTIKPAAFIVSIHGDIGWIHR